MKGEIIDFDKIKKEDSEIVKSKLAEIAANAPQVKFVPMEDQVLIQRASPKTHSAGGILIPDTGKKNPPYGQVLAVGYGRVDVDNPSRITPLHVQVGDTVFFGEHAGDTITLNGTEYLLMRESMIFGKIIAVTEGAIEKLDASAEPNEVVKVGKETPQDRR